MVYKMPVNYYYKNLAFGEKCVWAYYKIPGFYYDFLSEEKKIQKMLTQSVAFSGIKVEMHLLVLPVEQEIDKISEMYKKEITGSLKEVGLSHLKQVTEELKRKYGSSLKPEFYIGVKMLPYDSDNLWECMKAAVNEFKKRLYEVSDLYTITEEEIKQYQRAEKQIYLRLFRYMKAMRVTERETQFLIERNFCRGMGKDFSIEKKPAYQMREGKRLIESRELKRLTESLSDDSGLDYIKFMDNGKEVYLTFLCVSYFPHETSGVGNEFIYYLQQFEFPVEMSIRAKVKGNETSKKTVRGKKDELAGEIKFAEESGSTAPQEVVEGHDELENLEYDLKKSRKPLLETSVVFCVYASSLEEMRNRASLLKEDYKSMFEMVLEQPHGDQFLLFNEFLPGAEIHVTDYVHVLEPNFLASGMFGATKELGDPYGFFIGTTGTNNRLVFINPRLAAQGLKGTVTNSPSIAIVGNVGGGKSLAANYLCHNIVLAGGKVLILDPKGERSKWVEAFPEFGDELNIVTLFSDEEYRGLLDPWSILEGKDAEALAISILTVIVDNAVRGFKFKIITKAVKAVGEQPEPCMMKVVEYLLNSKEQDYVDVGEDIQAYCDISFSLLLFGNGKVKKTINLDSALNVLQIQNLALPEKGTDPNTYTIENILSVALLTPITAFAEKFIHSDRSVFKVFLSEEAWATLASAQGKQISNKMSREGRALNAGIYYISQDVGVLEGAIKGNIGMKFAFRCEDDEEVAAVLRFLDMEVTDENMEILKTLENGHCLFKDIYGHIGILNIDPLFQDLFEGWDTRPPMLEVLLC